MYAYVRLLEGDEGYEVEKAVRAEIAQFRREQAKRNCEEAKRRRERLRRQIQNLELDWQRDRAREKEQKLIDQQVDAARWVNSLLFI